MFFCVVEGHGGLAFPFVKEAGVRADGVILFLKFIYLFFVFRATPVAYGDSQV